MTLFSSNRERRLWLWTLAGALRERGLLDATFVLGFLLVLATIVTQGLKARPGGVEIAVALGVTVVYLLVFVRMALPEERTHLIEYGVVGVFIHEALAERASHGRRVPVPPLLAVITTAALGLLDECIRAFLPSRVSTHATSCSTRSRAQWRWVQASHLRGRGGVTTSLKARRDVSPSLWPGISGPAHCSSSVGELAAEVRSGAIADVRLTH